MFDTHFKLPKIHDTSSLVMHGLDVINTLATANDFSDSFDLRKFILQLMGGESMLSSQQASAWLNDSFLPVVSKTLLDLLQQPVEYFKAQGALDTEQLEVMHTYVDNLHTGLSRSIIGIKSLYKSSAHHQEAVLCHDELYATLDVILDHIGDRQGRKAQLKMVKITKGFDYLLSDKIPLKVRLELLSNLLQTTWVICNRVHNALNLDYTDINVFQAVRDSLGEATFVHLLVREQNGELTTIEPDMDAVEPEQELIGVVTPQFEIGYTPANLRKILEITKLRQNIVCEVIGKSRSVLHRYTLEADHEKHISMSNGDWNRLLTYIADHHLIPF